MGYDGSLKFDTEIDEKGFNSGITKLGGLAKGGLTVLAGAVASVATAMGAGVAAGVKYNASIEQYQTSFEVMTGSADKAADVIERLKKVGAQTPFELPDLADTTQLLMNYGFTADDAMNSMMMLGDISQGSADKMSRIATAYGQMSSAGKVQLEDIKQMIEAGFNPLQEISESTGESMDSLYDRISKGTLSVDEIMASMQRSTSEGGKYFQSMEKQSQTFSGLVSTLKDNAQQLLGDVVRPISDGLTETLLPAAISTIEQLAQGFEENGLAGMVQAGASVVNGLMTGLAENAPLLATKGLELLNQFLLGITTGLPVLLSKGFEIVTQIALGILQNIPQIITHGSAVITNFVIGLLAGLPTVLQSGAQMILQIVNGIINNLPSIVSAAAQAIARFVGSITNNLPQVLSTGIKILGQLAAGLIRAIPNLVGKIPQIISAIKNAFTGVDWGSIGMNIIRGIASGIASAAGEIVSAAVSAAKNAVNAVKGWLGIHSPSRRMRDEVGKYMALGVGVGFEKNIPVEDMQDSIGYAVNSMRKSVGAVTSSGSVGTTNETTWHTGKSIVNDNTELIKHIDKLANRPIQVVSKLNGRIVAKEIAVQVDEEINKNNNMNDRMGGIRTWDYQ